MGAALDRARHPRRLVFAGAVATVAGFAAASLLGVMPLAVIAVLLVAAGIGAPFYIGGLSSFVTDEITGARTGARTGEITGGHAAEASSYDTKAYAYDALSYNFAAVAGPGVVAVAGLSGSVRLGMWLMAGSAAVGAAGALALRLRARPASTESVLQTVAAGARHLTLHRPLAVVTASGTVANLGSGALPIAAVALSLERAGSAEEAAIIVTAFAVGGLAGALVAAVRPPARFTPQLVMGGGFALIGAFTLLAVPSVGTGLDDRRDRALGGLHGIQLGGDAPAAQAAEPARGAVAGVHDRVGVAGDIDGGGGSGRGGARGSGCRGADRGGRRRVAGGSRDHGGLPTRNAAPDGGSASGGCILSFTVETFEISPVSAT